ncbi:citrate synthase [Candidatus Methanoperedens nitroreducens]|uniref:Citrate synthase n=1 Tax=Candidatus Methanoperedens nitratireducens TaxID=1392998 RepID=A0A062V6Z7_9EURY|nr:citrate/2-methylcitrate synthase [Candidatus Methanoperedens nitroreducens]KCZ71549.1 citrate synthase [Candidatus Methanoperedens nitroreducens]MDJ1421176.1 citrate/2-methylcitrate synthase [Candidatus Methanoperedens sp.]
MAKDIGLRGIKVADTKICAIDGEKGKLIYRGYDIQELARYSSFEETVYLLLYETLPARKELEIFKETLASERQLPAGIIRHLKKRKKTANTMDVLQSVIPMLADFDIESRAGTKVSCIKTSIKLIAKMVTLVAYLDRIRKNLDIKKPDERLGHAANFLYMLTGNVPDVQTARDFDTCLVLHAEHSFNASTFAARVVASTRADMYACVGAALGALSGELHGGANTQVMKMICEIDKTDEVEEWVKARLDAGKKIMGMGHAVYKTVDPRAQILSGISERLAERTGNTKWFELSRKIENVVMVEFKKRKGKDIYPNVDFYSPSIYCMMGIGPELFTPLFAVSRIAGWCTHILEEKFAEAQPKAVLYRPEAEYIGRYCGNEGCKYVPIEEREYA